MQPSLSSPKRLPDAAFAFGNMKGSVSDCILVWLSCRLFQQEMMEEEEIDEEVEKRVERGESGGTKERVKPRAERSPARKNT